VSDALCASSHNECDTQPLAEIYDEVLTGLGLNKYFAVEASSPARASAEASSGAGWDLAAPADGSGLVKWIESTLS
jgi:hypothetical protein